MRNAGKGELIGVRFILENQTDSYVYDAVTNLGELEEKTFEIPIATKINNITKIKYAAIINNKGKSITGIVQEAYSLGQSLSSEDLCTPNCAGRVCGDNGCGGSCGTCTNGTCNPIGQCQVFTSAPSDYWRYWKFNEVLLLGTSYYTPEKNNVYNLSIPNWGTDVQFNNLDDCVSGYCLKFIEKISSYAYRLWYDPTSKTFFSISFWINPINFSTQKRNVLSYIYGGDIYTTFEVYNETLWVRAGTQQDDVNSLNATISNNTWTHVVFVLNSNSIGKLYINGIQVGNDKPFYGILWEPDRIYVGGGYSPIPPFNGAIDELLIYNRTLSDSEVQALYSADYNTL